MVQHKLVNNYVRRLLIQEAKTTFQKIKPIYRLHIEPIIDFTIEMIRDNVTSAEPSRVPSRCSWAEVCRRITSLAGGSSCRGTVDWLDEAPSIQPSLRLKRHKNGAQPASASFNHSCPSLPVGP